MEKVKGLISQMDAFIKPYIEKIISFLSKEYYVIYAAIVVLLLFLIIPGVFTFIKKAPKLFLLLLIILGIAVLVAYFVTYKTVV